MFEKLWNYFMIKRKKCKYDKGLYIKGRLFIHGKKNGIYIGNNCSIQSKASKNPTSGFNHTHLRAEDDGQIIIGNNVGISHANITSYSKVMIEDNVLLGSGVKIWDTDFHSIDYNDRIAMSDENVKSMPVTIKEGAFVGACSIVLKGVTIGKHAIVGAGSVIVKDIPDNEVWAGNPASFIRKVGGGK